MQLLRKSSATRQAFTLIEMMIVMGLIAMIMAVGIPAFVNAHQKTAMRQGLLDVLEVCAQARAQAILRGTMVELVIRPTDGAFSVSGGMSTQLSGDVHIALLGVNFQECQEWEEVRARFYPNGTADAVTVALQSIDGDAQSITVDMVTAYADVDKRK